MQVDDVKLKQEIKSQAPAQCSTACLADFRILQFLGNGAFGRVYAVEEIATGQRLVMKQTHQNPKFANREGEICMLTDHPCIVKFHYIFYEKQGIDNYLHLVMDEYPLTLQKYLDQMIKKEQPIPEFKIKKYMLQVLLALQYLHARGIAHRDLKPDNLLLKPGIDKLVLCDLGSAKRVRDGTYNKAYICSRLYRAPELLCNCENYSTKIDIWSAGCVMGECYLLRPIFPGKDNKEQLQYIQRLLGTLSRREKLALQNRGTGCIVQVKFQNWETAMQVHAKTTLSQDSIHLIKQMLQYDGNLRSTADLCIQARYFSNVNVPT